MAELVEATVKALTEFEAELDRIRSEAIDARKATTRNASDWAARAKSEAISKAQGIADQRVAAAREEAEIQASEIRKTGAESLKKFEESISSKKEEAAGLVTKRLLGAKS